MKPLLLFLSVLSLICAEIPSSDLSSDRASYNGDTLFLTGNVTLDNDLGHIEGNEATINKGESGTSFITMKNPSGELTSLFFPEDKDRKCQFASNVLIWDQEKELLTLKESIVIHDQTIGTLIADETLSLKQKILFGKRVLEWIEAKGKTIITTRDLQTLTSNGILKLDRDELLLTCTNPTYETEGLKLKANTGRIEYALYQFELQPHIIYLDGNVQIFSQDPEVKRRAVADHVIHDPKTKETRLLADPGKQVLFWDDEKGISLSAPEVLISQDEKTGDEIIKGIGAVRVILNEDEERRLRDFKS